MQKNSQNFSMQEAMRIANSDAGKRLLAILKQSDSASLQEAMRQVSDGNYESAQKALSSMLSSQEVQALIKDLGG